MALVGISSQLTTIERSIDPNWPDQAPVGGAVSFSFIGELKKITAPALTRKELETTNLNAGDDQYVVGIRRHGPFSATVNFVPQLASQDHLTGLQYSWYNGLRDIYRLTYPDSKGVHGTQWLFSGFVTNVAPSSGVDQVLEATIGIRPTGGHLWVLAA